ncbi:inositol monophosphatase [Actinosynnema sp. NPDC023794]
MKRPLDQLTEIAQKAVAIGNDLIKHMRPQSITEKSDRDTYTDVDVRIERKVRAYLAETTPEIGFIGEEEGISDLTIDSEYVWLLDPIDGTANFVHGIPLCAVQLALMFQNEAVVAAISLPYTDMHYHATKGMGAFRDGMRLRVSSGRELAKSIISIGDYATGEKATEKNETRMRLTSLLAEKVERIRMFGSAAHDLAWLAEGRTDAAVILSNNTLDMAGGVLMAREAGATVTNVAGDPYTIESQSMMAATPGIIKDLNRIGATLAQRS